MLGIAIAVFVLILVLSVVNGFERELRERLLTITSHADIEGMNGRLRNPAAYLDAGARELAGGRRRAIRPWSVVTRCRRAHQRRRAARHRSRRSRALCPASPTS